MLGLPYHIDQIAPLAHALDLFQGQLNPQPIRYVAFDTRTVSHGAETLFIALKTSNRDGHDFIEAAMEKGVRNFLVDRHLPYRGINYILVENTLDSLQLWAMYHRSRFSYPVIGITGSNGKTTVKEWLTTLLEQQYQVVKSPMSYNSQLGVALAVLQMRPDADLAIIEAGISQPGEMEVLQQIIKPTIGILTHIGSAHAEGFDSTKQKLAEKLKLFEGAEVVLATSLQQKVWRTLKKQDFPLRTIGHASEDKIVILEEQTDAGWTITCSEPPDNKRYELSLSGEGNMENALLAILAARYLGMTHEEIHERFQLLYPISMRTELITDNPEIALINDSYNSDVDSVRNAFRVLQNTAAQPHRHIILTDIPHQGKSKTETHRILLKEAIQLVGPDRVRTVGPVFQSLEHPLSYSTTDELIDDFRYEDFTDSTVLLKGARSFELERLIPLFNQQLNATYLKIDLNALSHNFRSLKTLVPPSTQTMCMVKAFSYGSGTWEIARELEKEGATYLAVAYASEGVELRAANIQLPIMVMNADAASIPALLRYDIEPEVHDLDFLERYIRAARMAEHTEYRIHLKLETGMGRLGFHESELDEVIAFISSYPDLNIISVMSHLAAADDPGADAYSLKQIEAFQRMYARLQQGLGLQSFRHILNTSGLIRFSQYAMEMVRLGIGLYGIDPTAHSGENTVLSPALTEIGSLHSRISQIRTYPAGSSIGYGRSQFAKRETRIAVVPIGYADGIPRSLSNGKMAFLVRGKRSPIFGRVCMDMLMLDLTDIPEAQRGDEVVLFGRQGDQVISISELAEAVGTIAYEILVRISPRVRRVYVRE